jgi:site-specific DNA-methyltransferase (adenine-specific)
MMGDDWQVITGDCLEVLPTLPDLCADAIITDLPYGTTACSWDEVIPFAPMWEQVRRLLKPRGAFVTTASQPFTSKLVMSNAKWFRYCWVWNKKSPSDPLNVKRRPMKQHEDIAVFSQNGHTYNPQLRNEVTTLFGKSSQRKTTVYGASGDIYKQGVGYPLSILSFARPNNLSGGGEHPTQKPVALYEYLIRTYTNEGDTVLDFTCGSGTTGVAAINTGRRVICIEQREDYANIARARIAKAAEQARQLALPDME